MDFSRPARFIAAGAFVGVGLVGGAVGVMALDGSGTPKPPAEKVVKVVASTTVAPAPATVAPVTQLQPGFEDYTPGDELPAAPPAPTPQEPTVSTVPGPYGPIYPDGYVAPEFRDQPAPVAPVPPEMPPADRGGAPD